MSSVSWLPDSALKAPELLIPKRKPTGRVELDWTHPLTRDLKVAVVFNAALQPPVNLVDGVPLSSTAKPTPTADGYLWDEVDDFWAVDDLTLYSGGVTVATYAKFTDNAGSAFQYFISYGNFAAVDSFNLYLVESGTVTTHNDILFKPYQAAADSARTIDYYTSEDVSKHIIARHTNSNLGLRCSLLLDGVPSGSAGIPDAQITPGTSKPLYIGKRTDSNTARYFGGSIDYVFVWDRPLRDDEAAAFGKNPYQFLKPVGAHS